MLLQSDLLLPRATTTTLEELPRTEALAKPEPSPGDISDTSQIISLPRYRAGEEESLVDYTAGVDMRYRIISLAPQRKGEETVGRTWPFARYRLAWGVSSNWGSYNLALVPATAGAAAAIPDRNTAAAVSAMPMLFFRTAPTPDFGAAARRRIETLAEGTVNAVRFMWRLAALWVGTRLCEENQGSLNTVVAAADPAPIVYVETAAAYASLLANARGGDVVPHRVDTDTEREKHHIRILALAASPRVTYPDVRLPSIVTTLPPLNQAQVVVFGSQANVQVGGAICSADIWTTAVEWCNHYGDVPTFLECVDTLFALSTSPAGRDPIFGLDSARCALPASDMGCLILGPLSTRYRTAEEAPQRVPAPRVREGLLRGAGLALAASLCVRHIGTRNLLGVIASEFGQAYRHLIEPKEYTAARACTPAMAAAEKLLGPLGFEGRLGRILKRWGMFAPTGDSVLAWWGNHAEAVQWEEALLALNKLPTDTALMGMLHPTRTAVLPRVGWWYVAGKLPVGSTAAEAMYGLHYVGEDALELGYEVTDFGTRQVTMVAGTIHCAYSGRPSDWDPLPTTLMEGKRVRSAFRIKTSMGAALAYHGDEQAAATKRYVERIVSVTADVLPEHDEGLEPPSETRSAWVPAVSPSPRPTPPVAPAPPSPPPSRPQSPPPAEPDAMYDPRDAAPQSAGLARALNSVAGALGHTQVERVWWKGLEPLMSNQRGDMEQISARDGALRSLTDGYLQTPLYDTLLATAPALRMELARSMAAIGRYLATQPFSATEVHHIHKNLPLWEAGATAMAVNTALTEDELRDSFKHSELPPSAVQMALEGLDPCDLLSTGDAPYTMVRALAEEVGRRLARGDTAGAAERVGFYKQRYSAQAAAVRDAAHKQAELELKGAYEAGIIPSESVFDVLGYLPVWAQVAHNEGGHLVDDAHVAPAALGAGVHDESTAGAIGILDADGRPTSLAEAATAAAAAVDGCEPASAVATADFGVGSYAAHGSQGAQEPTAVERADQQSAPSTMDFMPLDADRRM